jgi:hypothetical protein
LIDIRSLLPAFLTVSDTQNSQPAIEVDMSEMSGDKQRVQSTGLDLKALLPWQQEFVEARTTSILREAVYKTLRSKFPDQTDFEPILSIVTERGLMEFIPHYRNAEITLEDVTKIFEDAWEHSHGNALEGRTPLQILVDERTIEEAKMQVIRQKTSASKVVEGLLQGWLDGTYELD